MTKPDATPTLTIEDRLTIQEFLMQSVIWGPYLEDPVHRRDIAACLNRLIKAAERHQSVPAHVIAELTNQADGPADIDATPDLLKHAQPTGLGWLKLIAIAITRAICQDVNHV